MDSRKNTLWTKKEVEFLCESWGVFCVASIAERLGRTVTAVSSKAKQCGLGYQRDNSDMMLLSHLFKELGIENGWHGDRIIKAGLKYHTRRFRNRPFRMIFIEDFWVFAEKKPELFDFSKLEEGTFGVEPAWVKAKRKADCARSLTVVKSRTRWTASEERLLKDFVNMRYTTKEISKRLHRTEYAVRGHIKIMGLYSKRVWTPKQIEIMQQKIFEEKSYEEVASAVGKTECAVKGKLYATYKTKNLAKIRKLIQEEWSTRAESSGSITN